MEIPGFPPEKQTLYEQKQHLSISYNRAVVQMIRGHLECWQFMNIPTHFNTNTHL